MAALTEYLDAHPEEKPRYRFKQYRFVAWVCRKGYATDLECEEFHLGCYSPEEASVKRMEMDVSD